MDGWMDEGLDEKMAEQMDKWTSEWLDIQKLNRFMAFGQMDIVVDGTTGYVALMVQEHVTRMKTEHEIWCNGSGDLQPLLD